MTKAEQKILQYVEYANNLGALAGLSVSPDEPKFNSREFRFVKRLYDSQKIVWIDRRPNGAGWAIPGKVPQRYL